MAPSRLPGPASDSRHPTLEGRARCCSVLVADDDRDSREAVGWLLEMEGHHVHYACDGEEALRVANEVRPDVTLLDINMPGKDGYEVCRSLRDSRHAGRIIAVSALSGEVHQALCEKAGFDRQLVKPIDLARLRRMLQEPGR